MTEENIENTASGESTEIKCGVCEKVVPPEEAKYYEGEEKNSAVCICDECASRISAEYENDTRDVNLFRGLLFGIITGIVCGIIWYWIAVWTNTIFSIIAIGVGFLMALAVSIGSGHKRGLKLQILSLLITLCTFAISEGCLYMHLMAKEEGISSLAAYLTQGSVAQTIGSLLAIPVLPFVYFISTIDITGVVIWGIGLYVAFAGLQKEQLKRVK